MSMTEIVKVFGERKIRSVWDDAAEEWYFSVVDVVAVLTESSDPRNYWKVLKNRLKVLFLDCGEIRLGPRRLDALPQPRCRHCAAVSSKPPYHAGGVDDAAALP